MSKLEELKKKYDELGREIEKLENSEKSGKWIPEEGEKYYFANASLDVDSWENCAVEMDKEIIKYNKIFKTEEEAQEYAEYLKARHDYSYEFTNEEWENTNIEKNEIYMNYFLNKLQLNKCLHCRNFGGIYFQTREKAQGFINKYKTQILKYEFGIEE